jgi:hypothetical protein
MYGFPIRATLRGMQLIQIGEVRQKTVLDMVQEMALRQLAEIEQLKSAAQGRTRPPRVFRSRQRCTSAK